jgi:hypothetical protein
MKIHELFAANVTRDIPPVVYFHEQSPEKIQAEVSEYIITGGYPEGDPRARRFDTSAGSGGIHEQFVRLLRGIAAELDKHSGPELPSCWISGFYGSGKSSFAKLLGLALNGVILPDGTPLIRALLHRDDSPLRQEFVEAWTTLLAGTKSRTPLNPIAVVFDIGGVARDDEHIHCAILRQVQKRLGYCQKSNLVAEHELKLQMDGDWERFLHVAKTTLGKDWDVAKDDEQADDHFSHVMHKLNPERYVEPTSWIDSKAGARTGAGTAPHEVIDAIDAMMSRNAEGKTLFIVVDEVSQYVHDDDDRMLKLQSFVSALGQKMKGAVWLIATGQQKLDDDAGDSNLGKLKDRFRPGLRVHLGTTNIRDVVHKRLLKKRPDKEPLLRELFNKHRGDLKLHGYGCDEITEEDFVEVYPMLPGQVGLLMQITSNLRTRSTRTQGDDHAIRGLLQLLGELFRAQKLADMDLGTLVTLDAIFDVQQSALDADVQATLARIFAHPEVAKDPLAVRVAKVVALLELIQDQTATMPELVASCLYARLGQGSQVQPVTAALEKLRNLGLLSYSEKGGFKVQSSAGQEWERERTDFPVAFDSISEVVQTTLKTLVGEQQERPRYKGRTFPWTLWYSDGRQASDAKLMDAREDSTFAVDFRLLKGEREPAHWIQRSAQEPLGNRLVWVVGDGSFEDAARELLRSQKMVERYKPRWASLPHAKQSLVLEEETRLEELERAARKAVAAAFHQGNFYFRGQQIRPHDLGAAFGTALLASANRVLPDLYPYAAEMVAVTDTEILQLLEPELHGPSPKFLDDALGILSLDDRKYVPTCKGEHPRRIEDEIRKTGGLSGQSLIATFVGPPYGYPPDLVRACVAGLLRARKLRIRPEAGDEVTSYRDAGVRELFTKDRPFRKAEIFPPAEDPITARDRVAIRKFFETFVGVSLEQEDEAFADAAFKFFPRERDDLREIERRHEQLPGRPALPERLSKLGKSLEDCCRERPVQKIVLELKRHLDALRDGMEQLRIFKSELNSDAVAAVSKAARVRDSELAQLDEAGELSGLATEAEAIRSQLASTSPWRGIHTIEGALERMRQRYVEVRQRILGQHSVAAEQAQGRIKTIPGFATLSADAAHRVLRPILDARVDTTPDAVSPTLVVLRETFASRIGPAEEQARDRLDEERNKTAPQKVVKVESHLRGREIASREQLHAVFNELEERIGPLLDRGDKVRIS